MNPQACHQDRAARVAANLADRHGIDVGAPRHLPTDSSHSVFYVVDSDAGPALIKLVVDDFLAVGAPPLLQEYRALRLAWAAGLAPEPLHVSTRHRALVQRFLPWSTPTDWSTQGLLTGIGLAADLMAVRHTGHALAPVHTSLESDLTASRDLLVSLDAAAAPAVRAVVSCVLALLPRVYDYCRLVQPRLDLLPLVFSHNDVSPENTLVQGDLALLIDFETAGLGRPDFLYGQLAVDALLEDALAGREPRPVEEIWDRIAAAVPHPVSGPIRWARLAERLVQNVAYGLRQITRYGSSLDGDYLERKAAVARHGVDMLERVCAKWRERGEMARPL